jgi:hypothetical protein
MSRLPHRADVTASARSFRDGSLNVRTQPSGVVLARFVNGDVVNTYDQAGNWVYVAGVEEEFPVAGWVYGPALAKCREAAG